MIDLKHSKSKDGETPYNKSVGMDEADYPHGLTVHLDHESVKKLGLHVNPPKVGDKLHLHAHAYVKEVRQEMRDGKPHHSISLELRKMEVAKTKEDHEESVNKGAKSVMDSALAEQAGNKAGKLAKSGKGSYDAAPAADSPAAGVR